MKLNPMQLIILWFSNLSDIYIYNPKLEDKEDSAVYYMYI